MESIIVGAGLCGSVIARFLADQGIKVNIVERRNHIAGNMYDFRDENGILVQKYGPHTFHTNHKELYDFICRYGEWQEYHLRCMAFFDGKFTPTPFNFQTIDDFFSVNDARELKARIHNYYGDVQTETIVELLKCPDDVIRNYAQFLFDKDYSLYTAKQWGIAPSEIDVSVLNRVPVRFSYEEGYFNDTYQTMPKDSFTAFFSRLLDHPSISLQLEKDANRLIQLTDGQINIDGNHFEGLVVYTGALDELLNYKYGLLPYRSLRFEYETKQQKSYQPAPVIAYPQANGYTRITEYTKIPYQDNFNVTKIAVEYPLQYNPDKGAEPYYPIINEGNLRQYNLYRHDLSTIKNLFLCGRLADFKYYNMDQALERALKMCDEIVQWLLSGKRELY